MSAMKFLSTPTNSEGTEYSLVPSAQKLTDYSKPATSGDVSATDTVNQAIGKLETGLGNKQTASMIFTNQTVPASAWVSDATYSNFPYRAAVALTGVTATMIPNVILDPDTATGGVVAPIAQSYDGGIYLYAKSALTAAITIPTISMEVV